MQYHLSGKKLELTDHVQDIVLDQVHKLEPLGQHFPPDVVHVDVTLERHQRTQDFVVSLRLGLTSAVLVSKEQHERLETATKAAVDDVIDQLQRYKSRLSGDAARRRAGSELPPEEIPHEERALHRRAGAVRPQAPGRHGRV